MKTHKIPLFLFLSILSLSSVRGVDLYTCHPNPLLIGQWKITIQQNGTDYELKTSYLPQIYPGSHPRENVSPATRLGDENSWIFEGDGCEIDIYPNETFRVGDREVVRAFVPHCVYTDTARLDERAFFCFPME